MCPERHSPRGVTGLGAAVSGVGGCGEALRSAAQGYFARLSLPRGSGPGTPRIPVLSHPSATCTCTHRAARRGLQMAPMSLPAPSCPCYYPRLFPAPAPLPPGLGLSLGDPSGDGLGVLTGARGAGQGQEGIWCPQRARHRPCMLPINLIPHPGHAEVGTAVPPGCRGVFAARLPPVALQTLPCPSIPSCRPYYFLAGWGGREEPSRRGKRLHLSSMLQRLERGRAGACGCPCCGGRWGEQGWGACGGKLGASLGL